MQSLLAVLGVAAVVFAWTNIDDLLVLVGFFSSPRANARHIVVGQYIGIGVLYGVSVIVSRLAIVIPTAYIGLLGLAPIVIGVSKLCSLWRGAATAEQREDDPAVAPARAGRNIVTMATAIVANGGDNISVYTPLFASRSAGEVAADGLVFAMMTALWCLLAHWLVHHPRLAAPIRRYGHRTLPFLFIGFGVLILYKGGTLSLI